MFNPQDIFDTLPFQKIVASDLKQGDVVLIRKGWVFVKHTHLDEKFHNNYYNFIVDHFGGGSSYIKKDEEVFIIARSILNRNGIENIILKLNKQEEERARALRQAEEEERECMIQERDRLNRILGEK